MQEANPGQDRLAALELFKAHVPELRGHLQFIDFLIRAVMADMERFAHETDSGSQVFLKQLILMHLEHLELNSVPDSTTSEFVDAVRVWLTGEPTHTPKTSPVPAQNQTSEGFASDSVNMSGGRI